MSRTKWVIKRIIGITIFTWVLPFIWILDWLMEDKMTVKQAMKKSWQFYKEEALGIKPKREEVKFL